LNNRIRSSNVQVGQSLILGQKGDKDALSDQEKKERQQEEQEKELKKALESMLVEAGKQGKAVIEQAEQQACEIIKKAKEEAEILKQQSFKDGFEKGFTEGSEEGSAQAKHKIFQQVWGIEALTSAAFKIKKEIINSAEKEILELSVMIAEKIIRQQLELKPELMREIIKSAIEQLKDREKIKIIVNPALSENLYDFAEELKETIKGLKTIKITEDKTIPKDGVIVESLDSRIDARIETQLGEILKNLICECSQKCNNTEVISEEIDVRIDQRVSELALGSNIEGHE